MSDKRKRGPSVDKLPPSVVNEFGETQLRLPFHQPWTATYMCGSCGEVVQQGTSSWLVFGVCEECATALEA
jgi:hypothetical protein